MKHAGQTRVSIRQIQNKKGRLGPIATSDVLDIEAVAPLVRFIMFGFELPLAFCGEYENYTFLETS